MNDKKSVTVELTFDELEKVSGGEFVASPSNGAGVSKPHGPDKPNLDHGLPLELSPFSGFASGAAGGAGKPPT
jgi:hypothetical protein